MANGGEVIKKVKDAIKAKLVELGAYVDDELPDYIMVLVANKKTKDQMDEDLSLFLGHNTERFTSWLHGVLQKLNAASFLQAPKQREVSSESVNEATMMKERLELKKEKSEKRKEKKEKKKKKSKDKKEKSSKKLARQEQKLALASQTAQEDGIDKPVAKITIGNGTAVSTDEFHKETDVLDIQTDPRDLSLDSDDEPAVTQPKIINIQRTVHQVVTAPVLEEEENLKPKHVQAERKQPIHERLGLSNSKSGKLKEEEKMPLRSTIEMTTGMGRVLSSSLASAVRSVTHTDGSGRVQTKLEARVKPLMKDRVKRQMSDDEDNSPPQKSQKLTSVVRPVISQSAAKSAGVASKVEVTPRPRRAGSGQPNTALILRAVADAHKSVNRPVKRAADDQVEGPPAPKRKQIFTKGFHEQKKEFDEPKLRKIAITVPNTHAQLSPSAGEQFFDDETPHHDSGEEQEELNNLKYELKESEDSSDRRTRFIITMDGMPEKGIKDRLGSRTNSSVEDEYIEEVEEWEEEEESSIVAEPPAPLPETVRKQEISIGGANPVKTDENCKFWPDCKEGISCRFTHPSKTCMMFPNCKFGSKCAYVHPQCKFDGSCTKPNCPYKHTVAKSYSSLALPIAKIKCRFFPKCTDMNCPYMHPKQICRFGNSCKTVSCPFIHPDVAYGSKLKWTAPKAESKPIPQESVPS